MMATAELCSPMKKRRDDIGVLPGKICDETCRTSWLEYLPLEIVERILKFLDVRGVQSLACSSRAMHDRTSHRLSHVRRWFAASRIEVRVMVRECRFTLYPAQTSEEVTTPVTFVANGKRKEVDHGEYYGWEDENDLLSSLPEAMDGVDLVTDVLDVHFIHGSPNIACDALLHLNIAHVDELSISYHVGLASLGTGLVHRPNVECLHRLLKKWDPVRLSFHGESMIGLMDGHFADLPRLCSLVEDFVESTSAVWAEFSEDTVLAVLDNAMRTRPECTVEVDVPLARFRTAEQIQLIVRKMEELSKLGLHANVFLPVRIPFVRLFAAIFGPQHNHTLTTEALQIRFGARKTVVLKLVSHLDTEQNFTEYFVYPSGQRRHIPQPIQIVRDLEHRDAICEFVASPHIPTDQELLAARMAAGEANGMPQALMNELVPTAPRA